MSGDFSSWSTAPATNANADPSINWAEGQPKNSINDSARSVMAALASWRNDNYVRNSTGGTGNAYTITISQNITSYKAGLSFLVLANRANTGSATLSVNGLSALTWTNTGGTVFASGEIEAGMFLHVVYNATGGIFETLSISPHKHYSTEIKSVDASLNSFYGATTVAAARTALDVQQSIGYTPLQQGGGAGQTTDKLYIGWGGTGLKAQVNSTDLGALWGEYNDGPGSGLNADLLDGKQATEFAGVNTNTSSSATDYPVGYYLLVQNNASTIYARNSTVVPYLNTSSGYDIITIGTGSAALSGTWRVCTTIVASPAFPVMIQRVA